MPASVRRRTTSLMHHCHTSRAFHVSQRGVIGTRTVNRSISVTISLRVMTSSWDDCRAAGRLSHMSNDIGVKRKRTDEKLDYSVTGYFQLRVTEKSGFC